MKLRDRPRISKRSAPPLEAPRRRNGRSRESGQRAVPAQPAADSIARPTLEPCSRRRRSWGAVEANVQTNVPGRVGAHRRRDWEIAPAPKTRWGPGQISRKTKVYQRSPGLSYSRAPHTSGPPVLRSSGPPVNQPCSAKLAANGKKGIRTPGAKKRALV
jgi:hypothetical protein